MTLRRALGLAGVAGVLALTLGPIAGDSRASAVGEAPSVDVSATTGITDGQAVTITVRTVGDVPVYRAEAALCRAGVAYVSSTGTNRPAPDFAADGPNCPGPSNPISSSADSFVADPNTLENSVKPEGETFIYRLGSGVASWHSEGQAVSLTCGQDHPCALVIELLYRPTNDDSQPPTWRPFVFPITYGVDDPIAGCGGPAADVLQTGGSDRMSDAWVAWTLGACDSLKTKAPTRASFVGEGNAVLQFSNNALDLAYTAGGYDPTMLLRGRSAPTDNLRAAVAVPVALNAAVLAVGGGKIADASHKVPYKDIKLTAAEMAALVGGGEQGVESQQGPSSTSSNPRTYADEIAARNPEIFDTGMFDSAASVRVGGVAGGEALSWYATRYLKALAPQAWKVPDLPAFTSERGKARDVDADLAQATPSFNGALSLLSGRPAIRKGLIGPGPNTQGGIWILTDLRTAGALDLTPVQVQDTAGNFVMPTADALRAALSAMKPNAQGILVSNPTTAPAGAYPMAMVEYALVPAEPLREDDCAARPGSQKLLNDWLTYVTTDGQTALPKGLIPLTPELRAQAAAAIKKVGASPVTGACAQAADVGAPETVAPASTPDDTTSALGSPSGGPAPLGLDAIFSSLGLPVTALGAESAVMPGVAEVTAASASADQPAIPAFAGRRGLALAGTIFGLTGIICVVTLALFATTRTR